MRPAPGAAGPPRVRLLPGSSPGRAAVILFGAALLATLVLLAMVVAGFRPLVVTAAVVAVTAALAGGVNALLAIVRRRDVALALLVPLAAGLVAAALAVSELLLRR
jgi:hypothetical protein